MLDAGIKERVQQKAKEVVPEIRNQFPNNHVSEGFIGFLIESVCSGEAVARVNHPTEIIDQWPNIQEVAQKIADELNVPSRVVIFFIGQELGNLEKTQSPNK